MRKKDGEEEGAGGRSCGNKEGMEEEREEGNSGVYKFGG